jgi:serine/threonine protein kinase
MAEEIKLSKKAFIATSDEPITNNYIIERKIGDGTYGAVFLSTDRRCNQKRAIKQIPKAKIRNMRRLTTEIDIL